MAATGNMVLVVDDNEAVLDVAEGMLLRGGYSVMAVPSACAALEKVRGFQDDIHLLLTDVIMPEMDGLMLAEQVLRERSEIRVLLMSGYEEERSLLPLLKKPFRLNELLEAVAMVMAAPPPLLSDVNPSRDRVEAVLTPELSAARRRYIEASRNFFDITKDSPEEVAPSDGDDDRRATPTPRPQPSYACLPIYARYLNHAQGRLPAPALVEYRGDRTLTCAL